MLRTVTATEAKSQLGALLKRASASGDDVIIESRGRPKAALIGYTQYEELLRLREDAARRDALRRMEDLAARIGNRNQDLSDDQAERLADRFTREVVDELVSEGVVKFGGK